MLTKSDTKFMLYVFFDILWTIWRCWNDVIFERKNITNPMTLVKLMWLLIADWAILHIKEPEGRVLKLGAKLIERVSSEVYRASQGQKLGVLRPGG